MISAYKLPEQLVRLVMRLVDNRSLILIHYDKKSSDLKYQWLRERLEQLPSVVFLDRHNCNWGDFGHVQATIKGLNYLFENHIRFDYFSVITGQDYPLMSPDRMVDFLNGKSKSYISYSPNPEAWPEGLIRDRLKPLHFFPLSTHVVFPEWASVFLRKVFPNHFEPIPKIPLFFGSGYFTLAHNHAEYIWKYLFEHKEYQKFFKRSFVPDEMFFQSILVNSIFKDELENNNLRYIDWKDMRNKPKILRLEDFEKLKASGALFARKFDMLVDQEVLDKIDKELLVQKN